MNKIVMAIAGGVLAGTLVTTQVAGPLLAQENSQKANIYQQLDLFGDIFERIRGQYVEEVDAADLIEAAIDGMLSSLDPHSSYLSPEDAADMRVQTRGEFGGLGIEVTQEEGFVKVVSPIDDTPADEAGIEAGDFITHVDGDSVLGLSLDEAVGMMRGVVGSEIVITVVREGEDEPFDVTIVRDTIKLTAVRTRVEGARWEPAEQLTIKLEGARHLGERAVLLAGSADPRFIQNVKTLLEEVKGVVQDLVCGAGVAPDYDLTFRTYGLDAVFPWPEPPITPPREIFILGEVIAPTTDRALAVTKSTKQYLLHHGFPGRLSTSGNIAFPFTPPELAAGPAYRFNAYHLMEMDDLAAHFPVTTEQVG